MYANRYRRYGSWVMDTVSLMQYRLIDSDLYLRVSVGPDLELWEEHIPTYQLPKDLQLFIQTGN